MRTETALEQGTPAVPDDHDDLYEVVSALIREHNSYSTHVRTDGKDLVKVVKVTGTTGEKPTPLCEVGEVGEVIPDEFRMREKYIYHHVEMG